VDLLEKVDKKVEWMTWMPEHFGTWWLLSHV